MNDPIRELWAQCVVKHTKTPMNWQDVADEFAELIVNESLSVLKDMHLWQSVNNQNYPGAWHDAVDQSIDTIKEHFGVK